MKCDFECPFFWRNEEYLGIGGNTFSYECKLRGKDAILKKKSECPIPNMRINKMKELLGLEI